MKLTFPNVLCCFFWLLCSQCLPESQLKKAEPWKIAQVFKKCIVEDWVFCTATCPPEEGTIDSMIEGNYGMHIGEFITPALETYSAASLSSCCKKCTNYNNLHHRDIFGYICDYWSWDAKTGKCTIYDQTLICGPPAHHLANVFNSSKMDSFSFPAAC